MRTVISYSGTELTLNGGKSGGGGEKKTPIKGAHPKPPKKKKKGGGEEGVKYVKFLKEVGEKG